jgi:hypothetical protein
MKKKSIVTYDYNGKKVTHKITENTLSTLLSSFHAIERLPESSFRVQKRVGFTELPRQFCFDPENVLSSTSISLKQLINVNKRAGDSLARIKPLDIPDWICLRQNYVDHLHLLTEQILTSHDNGIQLSDHIVREFLIILRALRILSIKVMECFVSEFDFASIEQNSVEIDTPRKMLLDYGFSLPFTFDSLDVEPFQSICGVHLTSNPFCATHCLDGELAMVVGKNLGFVRNAIGECSGDDTQPHMAYNEKLVKLLRRDLWYSEEEFKSFCKFQPILSKIRQQSIHNHRLTTTTSLLSRKLEEYQRREEFLQAQCDVVSDWTAKHLSRRIIRAWHIRQKVVRKLKRFVRKRRRRIKRNVLKGFKLNITRERRISRLHRRYKYNLICLVLEGWKGVVIWYES